MPKKLRYFSMFTGIGGFELGIERAWEGMEGAENKEVRGESGGEELDGQRPEGTKKGVSEGRPLGKHDNGSGGHGGVHYVDGKVGEKEVHPGRPVCVGYSEIDGPAIEVFEEKFPGIKNFGDAFKIDTDEIPDFDLLVGGFPCQAFSVAGKRRGFEDTRGTLFFEIARICGAKRPAYILLENVKGLLTHEEGSTFSTILGVLTDLGYVLQWEVLNSKNFSVPQNRERVFIVGHLAGGSRPEIFPIKEDGGEAEGVQPKADGRGQGFRPDHPQEKGDSEHYEVREPGRLGQPGGRGERTGIKRAGGLETRPGQKNFYQGDVVYEETGLAPTLSAQHANNAGGSCLIRIGNVYPSDGQHGIVYVEDGISPSLLQSSDSPFIAKIKKAGRFTRGFADQIVEDGGISPTLRSSGSAGGIRVTGNLKGPAGHECHNVHDPAGIALTVRQNHGKITKIETEDSSQPAIRKLTPVECERLQGFPDGWTDVGVSESQRYKCLGNAVTVNVIEAIMRRFFRWRTRLAGKREAR